MSLHSNEKLEKRDEGRQKAEAARETRLGGFKAASKTHGADWSTCSGDLLRDVVVLITDMGGAAIVGMSRDKGAHSLTLLLDNERKSLWFAGDADLDQQLREVIGVLQAET